MILDLIRTLTVSKSHHRYVAAHDPSAGVKNFFWTCNNNYTNPVGQTAKLEIVLMPGDAAVAMNSSGYMCTRPLLVVVSYAHMA